MVNKLHSVVYQEYLFERKCLYVCITSTLIHIKHLIMTTTVAVGSVHVWQPWLVRFHRSASYRKIICMRLIIHEILDGNGILTVQQDLAWPFARMPSNLAARAYRMALIVAVGHGNLADLTPQNSTNVIKLQLRRAAAATSALS